MEPAIVGIMVARDEGDILAEVLEHAANLICAVSFSRR